jgi:hypothetical protein
MKFIFTFIVLWTCCILNAEAQENNRVSSGKQPLAVKQYKIDFEIKGVNNPDVELLSRINIEKYEYLRQKNKRTEVKDGDNRVILILYSVEEAAEKRERNLREKRFKTVTEVKEVNTPKYIPER